MAGKHINKQQVKIYMNHKANRKLTQAVCAAKSWFSERSARTINAGLHHTQHSKKVRNYKTRTSPIDKAWKDELEPMLQANPDLQPTTLFIHLGRTYIDSNNRPIYDPSCLRTLQRKVANWRATHGNGQDIIIPQTHIPGKQGLSDFTDMSALNILINNKPFKHILYHFRLVYSKWSYVKVIRTGESFQALSEGLQEALIELGGSPEEHRTDSLSAAYKNITNETKEDITQRYEDLCAFYGMVPTRNNKGVSHENGSVESAHGH